MHTEHLFLLRRHIVVCVKHFFNQLQLTCCS